MYYVRICAAIVFCACISFREGLYYKGCEPRCIYVLIHASCVLQTASKKCQLLAMPFQHLKKQVEEEVRLRRATGAKLFLLTLLVLTVVCIAQFICMSETTLL